MSSYSCCCGKPHCTHLRRLGSALTRVSRRGEIPISNDLTLEVCRCPDDACITENIAGELSSVVIDIGYLESIDVRTLAEVLAGEDGDFDLGDDWSDDDGTDEDDDDSATWDEDEEDDWERDEGDTDESFDDDDEDAESYSALTAEGRVQHVVERLGAAVPPGCRIEIAESSVVNGWTNGEKIWLTRGAVDGLSEGALAALVSHELAHIHEEHLRHSRDLAGALADGVAEVWKESKSGLGKKVGATLAAAGVAIVGSRLHSRFQELDADAGAIRLLEGAGYSADDARELHQQLEGDGGLLSTHPSQSTRLRLIDLLDRE